MVTTFTVVTFTEDSLFAEGVGFRCGGGGKASTGLGASACTNLSKLLLSTALTVSASAGSAVTFSRVSDSASTAPSAASNSIRMSKAPLRASDSRNRNSPISSGRKLHPVAP